MRRSVWSVLLCGGLGWTAMAQDRGEPADPNDALPPAASAGELQPGPVDPAAGPGTEAPLDTAPDLSAPANEPPLNQFPADEAGAVQPSANEPAADQPLVDQPLVNEPPVAEPRATPLEGQPRQPILPDAAPADEFDARQPPPQRRALPGDVAPSDFPQTRPDVPSADGLGAPPVEEPLVPEDDPLREPIERQPAPLGAQPVPRRSLDVDPAYGAPLPPPRAQPQVPIDEVARNPVRIYEARLLVLMGHWPAATDAIDTLARRFPTDARVPYLRFFLLSRTGERDNALAALTQAVSLERLYPVADYNRFMEPLQGPDRFYAERVRRAASELASMDGLIEPDPDEVLPEEVMPPATTNENRPRRDSSGFQRPQPVAPSEEQAPGEPSPQAVEPDA